MLAAFFFLGCASKKTIVEHRHADSIAVESRKAESLSVTERTSDYIREVIVMQADTAGKLRPVLKVVEKSRSEDKEKTAENMQKLDSSAFSSNDDINTLQEEEKPAEAVKTRFWRNAFFWLLGLAATVVGVVTLWRKTIAKWI